MALPQRDNLIDAIQKTDLLLEYAVIHGEDEEAERLRKKLRELAGLLFLIILGWVACVVKFSQSETVIIPIDISAARTYSGSSVGVENKKERVWFELLAPTVEIGVLSTGEEEGQG